MALRRAKSAEEYAEWVKSVMFEVGDLKDCMLYETESLTSFPAWLEQLEDSVKEVYDAMCNGTYNFGREDLRFMDIVNLMGDEIPFSILLRQINDTHRRGLQIDEDDD